MRYGILLALVTFFCLPATVLAQQPAPADDQPQPGMQLDKSKPIDIASDALEVLQNKQVAIFTGNVIAVQGDLHMRADQMIVFYRKNDQANGPAGKPPKQPPVTLSTSTNPAATLPSINAPEAKPKVAPAAGGSAKGDSGDAMSGNSIYRIESEGHVVFTNPTETAQGDLSIYDTDADSLDLLGNVIMTRDKNVLKGTKMHYNLDNGRSVLTGDTEKTPAGITTANGRVHGLFWPNSSNAASTTTPAKTGKSTGTPKGATSANDGR